jgi:hypothetical protein
LADPGDEFGSALAWVNISGTHYLAVGAQSHSNTGSHSLELPSAKSNSPLGAAYLLQIDSAGNVLNASTVGKSLSLTSGDSFGCAIASMDMNGDGLSVKLRAAAAAAADESPPQE